MPRVLFLTTGLALGGAEAQVTLLARAMKSRGWSVTVLSLLPPLAYVNELSAVGVPVGDLAMQRGVPDPRGLLRLASYLREQQPDVVHCHMVHANLLGRLARLLARVPALISTAHSVYEGGSMRELAYRATDFLSDLTTNVSLQGLERYVQRKLIRPSKALWVPNGVDVESYRLSPRVRRSVRASLGWADGFVWLAVGNLREPKDYPNMFRAFRWLADCSAETRLAIAGSGHLEEALRLRCENLGIADRVEFLGARSDVPQLLQAADGFVMSSSWEGTPMALLEAAASQLPCVATAVGGIPEVIDNEQTGLLVQSGDPEALAQAMRRICAMPLHERGRMGQAARDRVRQNFGIDAIAAHWERIYNRLIEAKAQHRDPIQAEGSDEFVFARPSSLASSGEWTNKSADRNP